MSVFLLSAVRASAAAEPTLTDNDWVGQVLEASPAESGDTVVFYECSGGTASCSSPTTLTPEMSDPDKYQVGQGDVGNTIYFEEDTAPLTLGGVVVGDSNAVGPVLQSAPSSTSPSIGETGVTGQNVPFAAGQTLTAGHGTWDQPPDSYNHTWSCAGGGTCAGQTTGDSYPLGSAQVGDTITLDESATYGPTSVPGSSTTSEVILPGYTGPDPTINDQAPTIGDTLTVSQAAWDDGATIADHWWRCDSAGDCSEIALQQTQTGYKVQPSDAGDSFYVDEVASQDRVAASATTSTVGPVTDGSATTSTSTTATSTTSTSTTPTDTTSTGPPAPTPTPTTQPTTTTGATTPRIITSRVELTVGTRGPAPGAPTRLTVAVQAAVSSGLVGTVEVRDGSKPVRGCGKVPVKSAGPSARVTCLAHLPAGHAALTAVFTPSVALGVRPDTSAVRSLTLRRLASGVNLSAPAHADAGSSVTYTATVAGDHSAVRPVGQVAFFDGSRQIVGCRHATVQNGQASCRISYGDDLTHLISARYAGSTSFYPSRSSARRVAIAFAQARGQVRARMDWTFRFTLGYTAIEALTVRDAGARSTVGLGCRGRGCPFAQRTIQVTPVLARGSLALAGAFAHRRLAVGTQLTVTITRPGFIAKYYRFDVVRGRQPVVHISCLAVGSTVPGRACRAG